MKKQLTKIVLSVIFGFLPFVIFAQNTKIFQTIDGKLGITMYYNDELLNVGSNQLRVTLDYETAEIVIKLDPSSLLTKIDSLDSKLRQGAFPEVVFKAKLGLDYINTDGHPPLNFKNEGDLTINGITKRILVSGTLLHTEENGDVACILSIYTDLKLEDFGLTEKLPGFSNDSRIEIQQAVLKPMEQGF